MKCWDKTILAVMMQWDYGKQERGLSLEKTCFYDNFKKMEINVEVLWYDEYLGKKDELQQLVIEKAQEVKPDLIVFVPYTDQFTVKTLDVLKQKYPTYAWFGDDQWRFDKYSSFLAPHFTYVSTTDPWSVSKYRKIDIQPILTQWAAQPYSDRIGPLDKDEKYRYDVSFIGGYNRYRGWFIAELAKQGIKVECFGAGWANGRVTYEEMEQIFRKSKINLNISNSIGQDVKFTLSNLLNLVLYFRGGKNAEQIKARNFEIPLACGFQLSNYVLGLEKELIIGKEIAVYNSLMECAQQIHYYLENEELRQKIMLESHMRAKNEHTYLLRLRRILEEIWD